MGAQPFIGRTYREADSNVGRVVVLRHDIWDTVFGRDPEVVGQTVRLNDEPYVVVGVMPPEFTAVGAGLWTPSEGRVPAPPVEVKGDIASNRRLSYLRLIGRLRPSVSLSGAQADADRIGEHLKDALASRGENVGLLVEPLHETLVGAARRPLWMLFGASALLLMITCVNVAGILIGRGVQRRRELAIRTALGAGRARLSAQLLLREPPLCVTFRYCSVTDPGRMERMARICSRTRSRFSSKVRAVSMRSPLVIVYIQQY